MSRIAIEAPRSSSITARCPAAVSELAFNDCSHHLSHRNVDSMEVLPGRDPPRPRAHAYSGSVDKPTPTAITLSTMRPSSVPLTTHPVFLALKWRVSTTSISPSRSEVTVHLFLILPTKSVSPTILPSNKETLWPLARTNRIRGAPAGLSIVEATGLSSTRQLLHHVLFRPNRILTTTSNTWNTTRDACVLRSEINLSLPCPRVKVRRQGWSSLPLSSTPLHRENQAGEELLCLDWRIDSMCPMERYPYVIILRPPGDPGQCYFGRPRSIRKLERTPALQVTRRLIRSPDDRYHPPPVPPGDLGSLGFHATGQGGSGPARSSRWVTPGEPDENVRTPGFALEIGAPAARAAGALASWASVWHIQAYPRPASLAVQPLPPNFPVIPYPPAATNPSRRGSTADVTAAGALGAFQTRE